MGQGKTFKHLSFFRAAGPVTAVFCSTVFVKLVHPSSISVVYFLDHPSSLELTVVTGGINSPNQIVGGIKLLMRLQPNSKWSVQFMIFWYTSENYVPQVGRIPQGLPVLSLDYRFEFAHQLWPTAALITGVAILVCMVFHFLVILMTQQQLHQKCYCSGFSFPLQSHRYASCGRYAVGNVLLKTLQSIFTVSFLFFWDLSGVSRHCKSFGCQEWLRTWLQPRGGYFGCYRLLRGSSFMILYDILKQKTC